MRRQKRSLYTLYLIIILIYSSPPPPLSLSLSLSLSLFFTLSLQPSTMPTVEQQDSGGSGGLQGGAIVGIVFGLIVALLLVGISVAVIVFLTRRKKYSIQSPKETGLNNPTYGKLPPPSLYMLHLVHVNICLRSLLPISVSISIQQTTMWKE